jgi:drug/metabolite transporter (DMT)-like permease
MVPGTQPGGHIACDLQLSSSLWGCCSKYLDVYFCTFFLSHPKQYQQEPLAQNMQEFLSRYLEGVFRHPNSVLAMCLSLIFFGSLAVLVRGLTLRQNLQAPHIVLYSLPFSLAALLLGIFLEGKKPSSIAGLFARPHLPMLFIMGVLSPFSYFLFFSYAFEALGKRSYEAYSINALWPIVAIFLSSASPSLRRLPRFFQSKHPSGWTGVDTSEQTPRRSSFSRYLALGLGLIGALWIITEGDPTKFGSLSYWNYGDWLALGAACIFGLYTALLGIPPIQSLAENLGWTTTVFGFQLVSFICALGYFLISRESWVVPDRTELWLVISAGALSFGFAYPLFFFARSRVELVTFAVFQNFLPLLALCLLAKFFPKETAPSAYWVGAAIVVVANLLNVPGLLAWILARLQALLYVAIVVAANLLNVFFGSSKGKR